MPERDLIVFEEAEELLCAAADELEQRANEAVAERAVFHVALAGGSTPKRLYRMLSPELPWPRMHAWFGDERCVAPDHADSNYRMVKESLLSRVPIPPENVHRMRGEAEPARAAEEHERELRRCFDLSPGERPRFDLVLLGMGTDGHTASLFPGTKALDEGERLCVANRVEALRAWRLTLTLPVLNAAARVLFLVSGADKAPALERVLAGPNPTLPASLVLPEDGELAWLVDRAASGG